MIGALLCWPPFAVIALRRVVCLASHSVLFAKISYLFPDEYFAAYNPYRCKQSSPHFMNAVLPLSIGTQLLPS